MSGLTLAEVDDLSDAEQFAWLVAIGEIEGGKWSWSRMKWEEPK